MKRNSLHRWLLATALLLNVAFCWSQENDNTPTQFVYVVQFAEIQSEEDLKNFDYALYPLFDSRGAFDSESGKITFNTNARIHREGVEVRLASEGLHLEHFEKKGSTSIHSNRNN